MENFPILEAPGNYLVFKRWDKLTELDYPLAVIFFADPDVLSGLFTLANFDSADPNAVISPMGSGCSTLVMQPLLEAAKESPKCILGMFDVSARPYIPKNILSFSIPMRRFSEMVTNMDESFLATKSWSEIKNRR